MSPDMPDQVDRRDGFRTEQRVLARRARLAYTLAAARICLGLIVLWAFLDKLLGLGFATCRDADSGAVDVLCDSAWLRGTSPAEGFLGFATYGPLDGVFQAMAGSAVVDWLFMLGLLLIGTALLLGIGIGVAAVTGSLLMLLLWASRLPPANNPLIDDHIIYVLLLLAVWFANDDPRLGLGRWWQNLPLVRRHPILR